MKDDLLAKLQRALLGEPETPAKGFLTSKQWAEKWGMSEVQARRYVTAGLKKKILEMKRYRVQVGSLMRPVPHYGPVKSS